MTSASTPAIKAVSLDFYGTLIYPRTGRGRGANLVGYLRSHGLRPGPYEHRMLYEIFSRHDSDYSPQLADGGRRIYLAQLTARAFGCLGISDADAAPDEHADAVWQILGPDAFVLYPEALTVLRDLRRAGYPLVLISNWQRGLEHFVTELGLADFFDQSLCSDELGVAKPDRRIFDEACERLGLPAERVLHVGDTRADDYDGGRAAGLQALLLHRGPEPAPADLDTIGDLRQLLPRLQL